MTGRAKWDAWNAAGKKYVNVQEAEARYMEMAKEHGWNEQAIEQSGQGKPEGLSRGKVETNEEDIWDSEEASARQSGSSGGLGFSVSTMAHTKEASEKTLHGFAVENDMKGIEDLLSIVPDLNLNELDEHVSMTCSNLGLEQVVEWFKRGIRHYILRRIEGIQTL